MNLKISFNQQFGYKMLFTSTTASSTTKSALTVSSFSVFFGIVTWFELSIYWDFEVGEFPDICVSCKKKTNSKYPVNFLLHLTSDLNWPWTCLSSKRSLTMTMVSWWLLVDVSSLFYIFGVGYAKESVWQYSSNFLPRPRIKVTHLRDETPLKQLSGHLSDVRF